MDIRRKLAVTVAAMVLAGQLGASLPVAAASQAQLATLQAYLVADDLAGLVRFVESNPVLLDPSSPLSNLLMHFMALYNSTARLEAFPPTMVEEIKGTLTAAIKAQIY